MLEEPLLYKLMVLWAGVTVVFGALVMYRSLLSSREDDQLFLDPVEASQEQEQRQLISRLNRLDRYLKAVGIASAGLLVTVGCLWLYGGLKTFW